MAKRPTVVALENYAVTIGKRLLVDKLSLTIREGERWAVLGVNGCGKSTLAKLLGQRLMSREFDRQVAEVQIRVAVLNHFTALGIPMTVAAE